MLKITHTKNAPMTKKRKAVFSALEFFATYLELDSYDAKIVLDFKYGFTELFNISASVDYDGAGVCIVLIDADISKHIAIQTIAHEMVHVKQYFDGRLSWDKKGLQLWEGKHVSAELKYTEKPWEIEAMKKEVFLMYKFSEFTGNVL